MRLGDEQFKQLVADVMKLDWTGLDLWLVGGITGDWDTKDIDCVIMGNRPEAEINQIMLKMKETLVWSPFYAKDTRGLEYDRTARTRTLLTVYLANRGGDTLRETVMKVPSTKNLARIKIGQYAGAPIQLIQNGTQIYL